MAYECLIYILVYYTLWLFHIAMENGPFIDDFPIKIPPFSYKGLSMAMLVITRWYILLMGFIHQS